MLSQVIRTLRVQFEKLNIYYSFDQLFLIYYMSIYNSVHAQRQLSKLKGVRGLQSMNILRNPALGAVLKRLDVGKSCK